MTIATIDLGKIKFHWRGAWDANTGYAPQDTVSHNGSSWNCVIANTNSAPATNSPFWALMAEGGNPATILTAEGDLLTRGASGLDRLPIGDAGKILKVNPSANGFEWGNGTQVKFHEHVWGSTQSIGAGETVVTAGEKTITPQSDTSRFFVAGSVMASHSYSFNWWLRAKRNAEGWTYLTPFNGGNWNHPNYSIGYSQFAKQGKFEMDGSTPASSVTFQVTASGHSNGATINYSNNSFYSSYTIIEVW